MAKKKSKISFLKIRDVKQPERGNPTDAGIDFFVPKFNKSFIDQLVKKNPQIFGESLDVSGTVYFTSAGVSNISIDNSTTSALHINQDTNEVKYEQDKGDKYEKHFKFDTEKGKPYFLLHSHQRVLIPAGIKSKMAQPDRALIAANKGGVASKHGVIFSAQVVDYEYQGEIHIGVINTSTKPVRIYEDMKLIQYLETPVFISDIDVEDKSGEIETEEDYKKVTDDFFKGHESNRGEGGFGSTNKIEK